MNLTELKQELQVFVSESSRFVCEVYFILKKENGNEIKFADIDAEDQETLKVDFLEHLNESIVCNADLRLVEISRIEERKNFIFKYDYEEPIEEFSIFSEFQGERDFEMFSFLVDNLNEITGIVFVLNYDNNKIVSYKHNYPINLYKRDSKAMGLIKSRERLIQIPEDILKVYPSTDFFYFNNNLFVKNLKLLERSFSFHEIIKKSATECIELLEASSLIENLSDISSRIDDLNFARKLADIKTHSEVLNNLNFSKIHDFINAYEPLKDKFKVNETADMFVLDTKKSQNLFLKVLRDDYLVSLLTETYYQSTSKDSVEV
ncbi:anti-phage protein KwaB [Exiguobacterium sp. CH10]|uniref:anti-phage protein KwaB n=1 Tax=Exiguobacterium sp. CH10 TaxID=2751261 RepID=UPI001BE8ABCB|nr:anti-phage protein KwaB [Exiguobacterium sp. CH10]